MISLPEPWQVLQGRADGEEALLIAHLSAAAAGGAVDRGLARGRAAAFALVTFLQAPDLHLLGDAENCFLEFQREVFAHVGTALRARASSAASAAEHIAESKDVAEDVLNIGEARRIESAAAIARDSSVAEAVIASTLLRVSQHRVGFAALFELLFRIRIVGIAVGMALHRQLAVGALDLLVGGGAAHAQDFVIVAFFFGSQRCFPWVL